MDEFDKQSQTMTQEDTSSVAHVRNKTILVTGANGYIGTRLIHALGERGYRILAVVRNKKRIRESLIESLGDQLEIIEADLSTSQLPEITEKIDAAYYLVHSMSGAGDFIDAEAKCATHFTAWMKGLACEQIVYLGALLPQDLKDSSQNEHLSDHLKSREKVRHILGSSDIPLTTLRASIIVGSGSGSFEIIRDLVEKLPVMITPQWVQTECQPIAIRNIIYYLVGVVENEECMGKDYDVGGPETMTYGAMIKRYAKMRGLKRLIIPVPFMSAKISSHWVKMFTATNYYLARNLIDSLSMKTVCESNEIREVIPQEMLSYDEAIDRAFSKIAQNRVPSTWYGSLVSGSLSHDQLVNVNVPEHGVYRDKRQRRIDAGRDECLDAVWSLGGKTGWPSMQWAWEIRGLMDKMVGGIGMRRGRRHPTKLQAGDALDFWRVILADRERGRLILYAEMKLPGEAWLDYRIEGDMMHQTATFRPKGLLGRLYWYSVYPLHVIIFPQMLRRLARGWKARREVNELEKL